jgi:cell division protein FtsL
VKHRSRELFVELERVNRERDRLEMEWGRLQLEQSAFSTHAFVENVAATNLGMRTPPPKQIEVVAP